MREDFRTIVGAINLLSFFMLNNDLGKTYSELITLLKIIITTPMSTAEPECCFSTLKRIKTFLRSSMNEDRLNALAMMSINENFIHSINNFDEKLIFMYAEAFHEKKVNVSSSKEHLKWFCDELPLIF
nr:unnamed protein product [Callosobruchus analis]